jgi:hypothetical protein
MATPLILPQEVLDELVFALKTSLGRIEPDELTSPTARSQLTEVTRWVSEAAQLQQEPGNSFDHVRLRSFPISGAELRALQIAVEQAALMKQNKDYQPVPAAEAEQMHQAEISAMPDTVLARLHHVLDRTHTSSLLLAGVLGIALILDVADLFLIRGISPILVAWINILMLFLSLAIWGTLHHHLILERRLVRWHWPLHFSNTYFHIGR